MAKMTTAELKAWFLANWNTNGVQSITGALLKEGGDNIADSMPAKAFREELQQAVTGSASNEITFDTPFVAGTDYALIWRVRDASGDNIDATVDQANQTVTGFTVDPSATGVLDYIAIEKY